MKILCTTRNFKMGDSRPLFLDFPLFNTVDSKSFRLTFEPWTSRVGINRCTN